jgi:hypothetical protein
MRFVLRGLLSFGLTVCLAATPAHSAPGQPTGIILEATGAHVGNASASSGGSVYFGDVITTEPDGHAMLRIGQTQFQLSGDTTVAFFPSANGPAAQLRHGTLIISSNSAAETFRVYASDVLVVPDAVRPLLAQVTFKSSCNVQVSSQEGKVEATSGHETKTIGPQHSYDIRVEFAVNDSRIPAIGPDDNDFHRGHTHSACAAAPQQTSRGKLPVAGGSSHFVEIIGGAVAIVSIIGIRKSLESPDRP